MRSSRSRKTAPIPGATRTPIFAADSLQMQQTGRWDRGRLARNIRLLPRFAGEEPEAAATPLSETGIDRPPTLLRLHPWQRFCNNPRREDGKT
jgi:hypothetical protein